MRNNTLALLAVVMFFLHSLEVGGIVRNKIAEPSVISSSLSHNIVTSIVEDSEGYIWIGTLHGLSRYNGSEFQTFFASSDSLSINNDHINCTYRDGDRLWIGTDMGVCMYHNGRFYHKKHYGFDRVGSICSAGDGYIIVASVYGLLKYDTRTYEPVKWYDHRGIIYGHRIWCMPDGDIWLLENSQTGCRLTVLGPDFDMKSQKDFPVKSKGGFAYDNDTVCLLVQSSGRHLDK